MTVVIAYCSTFNGMGVWCIETAKALLLKHHDVIVIKSQDFNWGEASAIRFLSFPEYELIDKEVLPIVKPSLYSRVFPEFDNGDGFIPALLPILSQRGIVPDFFLFNMPQLCNPLIGIPQAAVNWVYPITLFSTIKKLPLISLRPHIMWQQILGFYRLRRLLKKVPLVISLSQSMCLQLKSMQLKNYYLYPGIDIDSLGKVSLNLPSKKKRLLFIAHNLEQRKKGGKFVAKVLSKLNPDSFDCTFIGKASAKFLTVLNEYLPHARILPPCARNEVHREMRQHDVFIFASFFEDWGFVQQEAMAAGMVYVAPDMSPCDEIIPDKFYLFKRSSKADLLSKLNKILSYSPEVLLKEREKFRRHFVQFHSTEAYSNRLTMLLDDYGALVK